LYFVLFRYFKKLPDLLESHDVELRITAGEIIAVFYELGKEDDEVCTMLTANLTNQTNSCVDYQ